MAYTDHRLTMYYWEENGGTQDLDHRTVTSNLKISLRVPYADQKIVQRGMIKALIRSTDLRKLYHIGVSNRFVTTQEKYYQRYYEREMGQSNFS